MIELNKRLSEFTDELKPTIRELNFTLSRLRRSPLSIVGISIISFYVILAVFAPILARSPAGNFTQGGDEMMMWKDGYSQNPAHPSILHPFGTTSGQWDLFYGCIWGTRSAFRIGVYVIVLALAIGLSVGIVAGYYGGIIDEIMMRFTDIILAFPGLILAMAFVVILTPGIARLDAVLLSLILVGWPGYTRVIRGEIMRVKTEDYVEAAKAVGCSDFRIILRHIFPNAVYPILVIASLDIGSVVLTSAALSFLGLGAPLGYSDWGQIISFSRNYIYSNPRDPLEFWFTWALPGLFIFFFVLGWNLLGDAMRDVLDPTIRRR